MAFDWQDPLQLRAQLAPEEAAAAESAARFARERLAPGVTRAFREASFDRTLVADFGAMGLFGLTLDGHGCPGGSHVLYGAVAREIERVDSAYRSLLSVQSSLVMYPIHRFGSDAQRQHYLPALASGRLLGANGISDAYPVMRHMVNLETVNTYEGTHDVHALILGRAQTGIAAF